MTIRVVIVCDPGPEIPAVMRTVLECQLDHIEDRLAGIRAALESHGVTILAHRIIGAGHA